MIDLQKMRENLADTNRGKTHYEGCEYVHSQCAIEALCREVERLRRSLDRADGFHESMALRMLLTKDTLNESYDEGSPQAMALALAILDGDRNAIADAKRNMQKRQERAATYACPSCDIDDGWSGTDSVRERVYPPEPVFTQSQIDEAQAEAKELSETVFWNHPDNGWLPAPDTMPEEMAPAQMVEVIYRSFSCRMPAYKVVWDLASEYRPLYSESGLSLCSAEGLEEWARFVAVEREQVLQFDRKPHFSPHKEGGYSCWLTANLCFNKIACAPESHRRPGPWRESLMEVLR